MIAHTNRHTVSQKLQATLWVIGALLSFTGLAIAARQLSYGYSVSEILFFRSLVVLLVLSPFIIKSRGAVLKTGQMKLQIFRNVIHLAGQYAWVLGIAYLTLAEVFAIEFTMPIWAALIAVFVLRERLTAPRILAVITGFIGILIILRPGLSVFQPVSLIVLFSAIAFAISVTSTKVITRTDSPLTIILYMPVIQLPIAGVLAYFSWKTPSTHDLIWFALMGLTSMSAHFTLANALKLADAAYVMPIDFMRLPLAAFVGYLLYQEPLSIWIFIGAALIFTGNFYMVREEKPPEPTE